MRSIRHTAPGPPGAPPTVICEPHELAAAGLWRVAIAQPIVVGVADGVGSVASIRSGYLQLTRTGRDSVLSLDAEIEVAPDDPTGVHCSLRVVETTPTGDWAVVGLLRTGGHVAPVMSVVGYRGVIRRAGAAVALVSVAARTTEAEGAWLRADLELSPTARVAQRLVPPHTPPRTSLRVS